MFETKTKVSKMKKDGISKPAKVSQAEVFKCGECLHFKQTPHPAHEGVCCNLGVRSFGSAPRCFTPDYTKVIGNTDEFVQLINFMSNKTPQQRKILMGILRAAPSGRRLRLGTKVYMNVRSREYISNYMCGYVVGYTSAGQLVITGSPSMSTRGRAFFAYLRDDTSVLQYAAWKKKFVDLRDKGRIEDPDAGLEHGIADTVRNDEYEVPTIDNAPKGKIKKVKLSGRKTDLVQIMSF